MTDWTIMVYISADDVLANFAIESLNQLRRAAGDNIVVMAQFDPDGKQSARRFRFDGQDDSHAPLNTIELPPISPVEMTDPDTLTNFVDWASTPPDGREAKHYCLILWGHGTELLLDQDPSKSKSRYLTPANLKKALQDTKLVKGGNPLDVIALDACSMSMVELATELRGCVRFMVASQEEVPDQSFPYEQLLANLKNHDRDDVEGICRTIPQLYKRAFQDYVVTPGTGMKEITLSSLSLERIDTITNPLQRLAQTLQTSISNQDLVDAIILARRHSRDFVLGLFVDLSDFCDKLAAGLMDKPMVDKNINDALAYACKKVRDAIDEGPCVIGNQTGVNAADCHGVSIYFPFSNAPNEEKQSQELLGANQTGIVNVPLVKGGTNILRKARSGRIEELESDFRHLQAFQATGWGDFVAHGWSFVLAQQFPDSLDLHYSAQQCARNLLSLSEQRKPPILLKAPEKGALLSRGPEYQEQPQAS
jgi:hypothetical protein